MSSWCNRAVICSSCKARGLQLESISSAAPSSAKSSPHCASVREPDPRLQELPHLLALFLPGPLSRPSTGGGSGGCGGGGDYRRSPLSSQLRTRRDRQVLYPALLPLSQVDSTRGPEPHSTCTPAAATPTGSRKHAQHRLPIDAAAAASQQQLRTAASQSDSPGRCAPPRWRGTSRIGGSSGQRAKGIHQKVRAQHDMQEAEGCAASVPGA